MKARFYEQSNLVVLTNDDGFQFTMTAQQAMSLSYFTQDNVKSVTRVVFTVPEGKEFDLK